MDPNARDDADMRGAGKRDRAEASLEEDPGLAFTASQPILDLDLMTGNGADFVEQANGEQAAVEAFLGTSAAKSASAATSSAFCQFPPALPHPTDDFESVVKNLKEAKAIIQQHEVSIPSAPLSQSGV